MPSIRSKTAADVDQVTAIVALATQELRRVYAPLPRKNPMPPHHEAAPYLSLVAVTGNVVAGVVEYCVSPGGIHIRSLAVHPRQRQRGVARALIGAVERIAVSEGKSQVTLSTIRETGNPTIFAKLGFKVVDAAPAEDFHGRDGQPVTKITMCRILA
ncbi:MAG: GNAT family N-acetyltransferase [Sulfuricella sp.]|nr:GNAT family N-acetyltransferase [Sulfuricella sp.]